MRDSTPMSYTNPPSFKIDEGYAESQTEEHGQNSVQDTAASFVSWIQTLREETRAEIALEVLRTLRTSNIAAVVEKLTPLLHMDPLEKLPPEITSQIFSYLDATTLLTASLSSQTWRERILDPRLWQLLYKSQGWGIDAREVKAFEDEHANLVRAEFRKARGQLRNSIGKGKSQFKRRATSDRLESKPRNAVADVAQWREQYGMVEADTDATDLGDQEMQDVDGSAQNSPSRPNKRHSQDSSDEMDYGQDTIPTHQQEAKLTPAQLRANLLVEDASGDVRINWPYIYQQRHRLEENWQKARFTNFQLPHPKYPQEAHTECVYTIQFCGKWLVSGSRDKTLRVWDLETRRLRGKPLIGHSQSVLCLQFDPTEEEDVIISGSSDSSVIVWKFSTGQRLHVIPSAHEESVLNLKFDRRYLVTCSKDKKIKIWNRHTLTPLDQDYPRPAEHTNAKVPSYIIDLNSIDISILEARIANGHIKSLQPYTHLMTLEGHAAAVNAIQISGDLIVSASGDRLIRVWNAVTGVCLRVIPGHQKGIACVQFDSKRIVSGSSDDSVRIFDPMTSAEVAVLKGHTNLVRTVQAGFGDAPGSEEDDRMKAREAERSYIADLESGKVVEDRQYMRRLRNGDEGSSRTAMGSNLPPGGGGSKWGRIVSGSYDESIIIWKKDLKGNWVIGHVLRQHDAVLASVENDRLAQEAENARRDNEVGRRSRPGPSGRSGHSTNHVNNATLSASQIVQQAVNASMNGLQTGISNVMGLTRGSWSVQARASSSTSPSTNLNAVTPAVQAAVSQIADHARIAANQAIHQVTTNGEPSQFNFTYTSTTSQSVHGGEASTPQVHTSIHPAVPQQQIQSPSTPINQQVPLAAQPPPRPSAPLAAQAVPAQAQANAQGQNGNGNGNGERGNQSASRVFKLQFDSRRIVCCSQDSRIVGWDFANGDPEIEAVAGFFVGP